MALPTVGDLVASINPFGTSNLGQWNLARGVYTQKLPVGTAGTAQSIVFFYETPKGEDRTQRTAIDQISDSGGRRLAIYEYPYRDGQAIKDLGRKGEKFTFNIKFHGQNYQVLFEQFIKVVANSKFPGTIIHPVRSGTSGAINVKFQDYEFIHRHDEFNSVTIKATFIEDQTDTLLQVNAKIASPDTGLRGALQTLSSTQQDISQAISDTSALLLLPGAIAASMQARLTSITGQVSRLLGQLASTFSSNSNIQSLAAQSSGLTGGLPTLNSGTTTNGSGTQTQLPPVFQVGFDPTTQASINAQISAFTSANTITTQQAVFNANQSRLAISAAISEASTNLGNDGYAIMLSYRGLAVSIQEATEACIAATQSLVKIYVTPSPMSLRTIAVKNGLQPDRQNDIEMLNPYLASVNYVPKGTSITVPAA
jgi:hypothetical protein